MIHSSKIFTDEMINNKKWLMHRKTPMFDSLGLERGIFCIYILFYIWRYHDLSKHNFEIVCKLFIEISLNLRFNLFIFLHNVFLFSGPFIVSDVFTLSQSSPLYSLYYCFLLLQKILLKKFEDMKTLSDKLLVILCRGKFCVIIA